MTPEGTPATEEQVVEAAEVSIAAAAVTLETLRDAIEAEAEVSIQRQEELLREVRECQTRLEALSASMARQTESPSLQQLLMEVGQIQAAVTAIQADLTALMEEAEPNENPAPPNSEQSVSPTSTKPEQPTQERSESESESGPKGQERNQPPTPSPNPPPKKKHYVRI